MGSTSGQIFSVCNYKAEAAGILALLQKIMAEHPSPRPVMGVSHKALRCKSVKSELTAALVNLHKRHRFRISCEARLETVSLSCSTSVMPADQKRVVVEITRNEI